MLAIVHHPDYQIPLRAGHRFPMSKYGYLRQALMARGLMDPGRCLSPAPAAQRLIELAHDPDYVSRVFADRLGRDELRRIGLPGGAQMIRRVRLSASGTLLAGWLALEHGIALNAAGGSHHAGPEGGAGFCVFNDVAVAVRALRAQGVPGPVLIVDADVHQGDGTARIFAGDDDVRTLSIHAARNYPTEKAVSDIDISLPDGTDDTAYLDALSAALTHALDRFAPTLVFYNAGVDVHADDKLGRLALSNTGIRERDARVITEVRSRQIPLVGVLGGGYSDDMLALATRHAILFEEAARIAQG